MLYALQVWLLKREELLLSMIHGLGAISNCILQRERAKWAALGPDATPQMQQLLTAVQQQEQEISRQLDLVSCVQTPGWEQQHNESLAMMGRLFDPQYVQQVGAHVQVACVLHACITVVGGWVVSVYMPAVAAWPALHTTCIYTASRAACFAAPGSRHASGCSHCQGEKKLLDYRHETTALMFVHNTTYTVRIHKICRIQDAYLCVLPCKASHSTDAAACCPFTAVSPFQTAVSKVADGTRPFQRRC